MNNNEKTLEQALSEIAALREENDRLRSSAVEYKRQADVFREAEDRLKSIFESSQDCICQISLDGKYLGMHAYGLAVNEYDSVNDVIGLSCTDNITENRQEMEDALKRVAQGETVHVQYKSVNNRGTNIWWDSKITPVRDGEGNITNLLRISRNITERKRLDQEMLRVNKLESIGTLASGIAHDFNNILTIILGQLSLARMHAEAAHEILDILSAAEKACKRAKDLTKQFLTFSKGGLPVKKITRLEPLLYDSVDLALKGSGVRCEFSIPSNLSNVDIDEGQMGQVINALIINAEQAMGGSGIIKISADEISGRDVTELPLKDQKYVKISIKDQGAGISEEHIQKIFDPYFSTKRSGSGLGLAVAYSVVNKHDGYITVNSKPKRGSTFHIYLPACAELKQSDMAAVSSESSRCRVLIMDDEEMLRDIVKELLILRGYHVEVAKDGREAIGMFSSARQNGSPFDVLIMDLTVPGGMGGKEAIVEIRKIQPDTKAIVSSGYSDDPVMADFKSYGFNGVVAKPYRVEEVITVFSNIFGRESACAL